MFGGASQLGEWKCGNMRLRHKAQAARGYPANEHCRAFRRPRADRRARRPRQEDAAHSRAAALERGAPAARLARPADARPRRPPRSHSGLPGGNGHLRPDRPERRRQLAARAADLLPEPAGLGGRREALRPLRLRRGAHRPLDRRRPRRGPPPGHGRKLALLRLRRGHAARRPRVRPTPRLLALRHRRHHRGPGDRAWGRAAPPRLRPEHDHRRSRRRRPARGEEAAAASRVRAQPRRLRRRPAQGADLRASRTSPSSAGSASFRRWSRSWTSSA